MNVAACPLEIKHVGDMGIEMPPFCEQSSQSSACPEEAQDVSDDLALPETDTPSSSPSPPRILSPPVEELPVIPNLHIQHYYFDMNPLPMMQDGVPDFLPIDHNLPQLLRRVTGTDDLLSVQELKLRVISREMSLQRLCLYMPALRELNLTGSCLGSLRDLGCELRNLHVLRINRCGLDSLDGTMGLTSIRELYAAHNKIEDVSPCTSLPHIRVLDLRCNRVHDTGYVSFLSFCDNLQSLVLAECPVSRQPGYRAEIKRLLPKLVILDDVDLDREQNAEDDLGFNEDFDDNDGNGNDDLHDQEDMDRIGRSNKAPCSLEKYVDEMNRRNRQEPGPSDSQSSPGLSMNGRKLQPISQVKQRPLTAGTCRAESKNYETLRQRPFTAHSTRPETTEETKLSSPPDFRADSHSNLTSGDVVYGSPATALRRKKKQVTAWEEEKPHKNERDYLQEMKKQLKEGMINISNKMSSLTAKGESVESIRAKLGMQGSSTSEDTTVEEDSEDLLKASQRWRSLYHAYRSENRARWEKERLEEFLPEAPTEDKKLESHRKIIKKIHEKSTSTGAGPCCSAIFGPKMKNSGTCDSETYIGNADSRKLNDESKKKKDGKFPMKLY